MYSLPFNNYIVRLPRLLVASFAHLRSRASSLWTLTFATSSELVVLQSDQVLHKQSKIEDVPLSYIPLVVLSRNGSICTVLHELEMRNRFRTEKVKVQGARKMQDCAQDLGWRRS